MYTHGKQALDMFSDMTVLMFEQQGIISEVLLIAYWTMTPGQERSNHKTKNCYA